MTESPTSACRRLSVPFIVAVVACTTPIKSYAAPADSLYVLLVIDTNASKVNGDDNVLRPGMQANRKILKQVLSEIKDGLKQAGNESAIEIQEIVGDDVSLTAVKSYYNRLRQRQVVKSNTNLFFYYCGHGATDKAKGHYFASSGGDILRSEVRDLMTDLNPRSAILISDCCSSPATYQPPARNQAGWKAFRYLFLYSTGLVDFTAATEPEFGWIDSVNGGMFTRALTNVLCEPKLDPDDIIDWNIFFLRVRATTRDFFIKARDESPPDSEIRRSSSQTPYAFSLGAGIGRKVFENRWVAVMRSGTGYNTQYYRTAAEFPIDFVKTQFDKGYYITSVGYGNGEWAVVTSSGTGYKGQYTQMAKQFPVDFVQKQFDKGYYITSVGYGNGEWAVVTSKSIDGRGQFYAVRGTVPVRGCCHHTIAFE